MGRAEEIEAVLTGIFHRFRVSHRCAELRPPVLLFPGKLRAVEAVHVLNRREQVLRIRLATEKSDNKRHCLVIGRRYFDDDVNEHWSEVIGGDRAPVLGQRQQIHDGSGAVENATNFVSGGVVSRHRLQRLLGGNPRALVEVNLVDLQILVVRRHDVRQLPQMFVQKPTMSHDWFRKQLPLMGIFVTCRDRGRRRRWERGPADRRPSLPTARWRSSASRSASR